MRLWVNGEARDVRDLATVLSFLEEIGLDPARVAVERNREIVPRSRWLETWLAEGDRLEIVTFVGGG